MKTFPHFSYKNGSPRRLLIAFTERFEQWMSNSYFNSLLEKKKISPPKIYKLNCLTKVCTGHSVLASYRLSRKSEVYNRNKTKACQRTKQREKTTNRIK